MKQRIRSEQDRYWDVYNQILQSGFRSMKLPWIEWPVEKRNPGRHMGKDQLCLFRLSFSWYQATNVAFGFM